MHSTLFLALLAALLPPILAANPGQTMYYINYSPPPSEHLLSFTGHMLVPHLPHAGFYDLWPGLQAADGSGVLQPVLTGGSGQWAISSGWCCGNPTPAPFGPSLNAAEGQSMFFNLTRQGGQWAVYFAVEGTGESNWNYLPELNGKTMNQAGFVVELWNQNWDFGNLVFRDAVITATGSDTSWCSQTPTFYSHTFTPQISGVRPEVGNGVVNCNLDSVTLVEP